MSEITANDTPARNEERGEQTGLGRRDYMKLGSTLVAGAGVGGLATGRASAHHGQLEDPAPADLEVGGGATYDRKISRRSADFVVDSKNGLIDALDRAGSGDVVYVADSATIDLSGVSSISLSSDVTLASGRGDGSMGALLYTSDYSSPLFKVYGSRVRFSGLRIRGPRWDYFETTNFDYYSATGIWLLGDDGEIDNCQFYGWTQAAISVGARSRAVSAHVHHNSIHNNQMEGLGYGVNLYNGHSLIEHNYFDRNRHSVDGFGYETNGYEARYNLVGPNAISHAFDMHCLSENGGGGNRAGGTIKIHHNTFEFTHDQLGRAQEAIAIRGVPADGAYIEKNWFAHPEKPNGTNVSEHGQAYRQNNLDSDNWRDIWASGNKFGEPKPPSDVGCPRSRRWRPASAVAASDENQRADVSFQYPNCFGQEMTITDVAINPRSDAVARLADGTHGEGRWASEVHVDADVQDGCTDIGGGLDLPATVDLDSDGHSSSPDTEPVLSAGSTASVALTRFCDRNDNPVDMDEEVVHFAVSYRLADGTTGVDEFSTQPLAEGELHYNGDATAVANGGRMRSGVEFSVQNWFDQQLTVTDVRLVPASKHVAKLADGSWGEGRWASEVHVDADVQDGCTDVGSGLDLPGSIDLDRDGHSSSPDTEPVLSADSTASVALWEFQRKNGKPKHMVDEQVDVELTYRLADGETGTTTFTLVPTS